MGTAQLSRRDWLRRVFGGAAAVAAAPLLPSPPATPAFFGEVTLKARRLGVLVKFPNELLAFASPAAEVLLRDEMARSLARSLDLQMK